MFPFVLTTLNGPIIMPISLTNGVCLKCAHPHMVQIPKPGEEKVRFCFFLVRKGIRCKCRKFVPIPRGGNIISFAEWKHVMMGDDPPPTSPLRLSRRRYAKVRADGRIIL